MNILNNIRRTLHKRSLNAARQQRQLRRESMPFDQVKRVALLFDSSEMGVQEQTLSYANQLKKQGRQVELLGYVHSKEPVENLPFPAFNRKDVDWLWRPKGEVVTRFMDANTDLLIYLGANERPWLHYIAALSHARFRVGLANSSDDCYELMIDLGTKKDWKEYLRQAEFFLQKMHATNEKPSV
jgi:hypothetical protein